MTTIELPTISFLPVLTASVAAPTVGYGAGRSGRYTRVGNLIFVELRLDWESLSGGNGNVYITMPGLPSAGSNNFAAQLTASWFGITLPAETTGLAARIREFSTTAELIRIGSNQSSALGITPDTLAQSGRIALSGVYISG